MNTESELSSAREEVIRVKERISGLVFEKREVETELAGLNNRVRRGGRLPTDEYKGICKKQTQLKNRVMHLESAIIPLRSELRRWQAIEDEAYRKAISGKIKIDVMGDKTVELVTAIRDLRDRYLSFSEDYTRMNSMRLLSSQVATDLTSILARVE